MNKEAPKELRKFAHWSIDNKINSVACAGGCWDLGCKAGSCHKNYIKTTSEKSILSCSD
jgi:hypothetical protein